MKYLLILISLACLVGCDSDRRETPIDKDFGMQLPGWDTKVLSIDGCQYFYGRLDRGVYLTHKGNCNNPVHAGNCPNHVESHGTNGIAIPMGVYDTTLKYYFRQ